jgi:hypothetical protein
MNMNMINCIIRSLPSAFAVSLAFLAFGCGDDGGLGHLYSVSGKVSLNGQPVKKGVINFVPTTPEGHGATGMIEDGTYSLSTLNPGDGALPGKYKVTVDDRQLDMEKLRSQTEERARKKGVTIKAIPQELQAKALREAKGTIPGKYQVAETSDLEKEVQGRSNTIDIELKN